MAGRDRDRGRPGGRSPRRGGCLAAGLVVAALSWSGGAAEPDGGPGFGERFDLYPDLHTVRVAVQEQGNLNPALARAMREMLVRATGLRRPETSPGVEEALANPESFVQQYLFESDPEFGLIVKFDEGAVSRIVERLGLGWWSRVRPLVVVWLVVEGERGRKSYVDSASAAAAGAAAAGDERGLPLLFPLLDIEDRVALPEFAVWGGFPEPIRRASERYAADAILVGRAYRGESGLWQARWTLLGDEDEDFRTAGESLEAAAAEGVHQVADRFAARFARRGEAAALAPASIAVAGVERLEDYARVLRYLASIDVVEELQVVRVEPSRVRLVLRARGGRPALAELIALGRTLVPEAEAGSGATDGAENGRGGADAPGTAGGKESAASYRLR